MGLWKIYQESVAVATLKDLKSAVVFLAAHPTCQTVSPSGKRYQMNSQGALSEVAR